MNVLRLIFIAAVIWVTWRLYRVLRNKQIGQRRDSAPPESDSRPGPDNPKSYEPMTRCARCGVHAPADALSKAGLCGRCGE